MYRYNEVDQKLVEQRVEQFRDQTARFLSQQLSEDRFKPLRLQNGLYIQRHAPMLRIAIPYGTLGSNQLRKIADICDNYDRGYGHFTTRQNIQLNWIQLEQAPDVLAELAKVEMHAIQTSGNCIRNVTSDPLAGCVAGEAIDPRVICELVRKWSTFHPEFAFLPRKFKIAVVATEEDRAAIEIHDIGLRIKKTADGEPGFDLWVGGGLGRTPHIGKILIADEPIAELLNYLEATLRVYNIEGRRDNLYKSRIKILVNALGIDEFRKRVIDTYNQERDDKLIVRSEQLQELAKNFQVELPQESEQPNQTAASQIASPEKYERWKITNLLEHKLPGYSLVHISLKRPGIAPGDLTSVLMRLVADMADEYSGGEIRVTHDQSLVLPNVRLSSLEKVYEKLEANGLAHPNRHLVTDAIACPGLDFCSLANAPTIQLADELHTHFPDLQEQLSIGPLEIKMSGCMNACGHHHIGNIGILGVEKKGEYWYQITLGGKDQHGAALGAKLGPSVPMDELGSTIRTIVDKYLEIRDQGEIFTQTVDRVGVEPFKEAIYAVDKS